MNWQLEVTVEHNNFKVKWPKLKSHCTKNVTKCSHVLKSIAYMINQLGGDFRQGGCLCKPTSGIPWTPEHS